MDRREFLTLAAGVVAMSGCRSFCTGDTPLFGACCSLKDVVLLQKAGYDFFESGVSHALCPDENDSFWQERKEQILQLSLPLRSCNGFLPARFRLTGPKASFAEPLDYATCACRRADEVGLRTIVFGSGGARNAPPDFPIDEAIDQFIDFCRQLAQRIADCRVTVVLEPLQAKEANFLNFVREGVALCRAIHSPRIRLLADLFHMQQGDEGADALRATDDLLKHCHIAEKGGRLAPGLSRDGSEFLPYFKALKAIGYTGGISCECGWGAREEKEKNLAIALKTMKRVWANA